MPVNTDENLVIKNAKKIDNVSKYIGKSTIIKNIYLKNKLVNFITKKWKKYFILLARLPCY